MSTPPTPSDKTVLRQEELYRDRWTGFDAESGILKFSDRMSAAQLREWEIFRSYDDNFLEEISPDVSRARWKKESVLFEEGSYIDLAFLVVEGEVDVYLAKQRRDDLTVPIFDPNLTQIQEASPAPPAKPRDGDDARTLLQTRVQSQRQRGELTLLASMDFDLPRGASMRLGPGEIFGEIGALNGWPQSVTAKTATDCELIQIRIPSFRKMKIKSKALKERIDALYKQRSLFAQLRRTPLLAKCDEAFVEGLAQRVELASCTPGEIIAREGDEVQGLYLIRSGFVRLAQTLADGEVAVSYLSKGMTLGEAELLMPAGTRFLWTASAVANVELVKIGRDDFRALIEGNERLKEVLWEAATGRMKQAGYNRRNIRSSEFIDAALDQGLVEGTSILVIDLDVCTRCDDCVRACASTHEGTPRFVREGNKYANLLITRACYHCMDPLCLIGCPTGAIHRADVGEVVQITDSICIGCKTCANNCPYDAITMVDTKEKWSDDALPKRLRGTPRLLATKCDLCCETGHDPACVRNCPHGCAIRVGSLDEFQAAMARRKESF